MTQAQCDDILTRETAAQYLCVSPATITRMVSRGELRHARIGHVLRFRRAWLDAWLDSRAQGGGPAVLDEILDEIR